MERERSFAHVQWILSIGDRSNRRQGHAQGCDKWSEPGGPDSAGTLREMKKKSFPQSPGELQLNTLTALASVADVFRAVTPQAGVSAVGSVKTGCVQATPNTFDQHLVSPSEENGFFRSLAPVKGQDNVGLAGDCHALGLIKPVARHMEHAVSGFFDSPEGIKTVVAACNGIRKIDGARLDAAAVRCKDSQRSVCLPPKDEVVHPLLFVSFQGLVVGVRVHSAFRLMIQTRFCSRWIERGWFPGNRLKATADGSLRAR